jgi:hypothetical protein
VDAVGVNEVHGEHALRVFVVCHMGLVGGVTQDQIFLNEEKLQKKFEL